LQPWGVSPSDTAILASRHNHRQRNCQEEAFEKEADLILGGFSVVPYLSAANVEPGTETDNPSTRVHHLVKHLLALDPNQE
jgi:hypothetical protein